MRALIKPQLKGSILHRNGKQRWTAAARRSLERALALLHERLGSQIPIHLPVDGDFHFIADVADADSDESRASAAVFSKALPDLWIVCGRLFLKNGQFFRRQYGYKLALVPATDIHLSRALRAAISGPRDKVRVQKTPY